MSASTVIYDCDDFEVIRRDGNPELLLITFSSLGMFGPNGSVANGHLFWARNLADKLNYSAIGFVAKRRDWFCSMKMPEACKQVANIGASFEFVVNYGSSMGGYAALRWGRALRATTTVVFAPQASIDPQSVAAFDTRYIWAFNPAIHKGMEIQQEHISPQSFIISDPREPQDWGHFAMIRAAAPSVRHIPLSFCGHECVRAFSKAEIADALLRACAKDDLANVITLASTARKTASIRIVEVTTKLASRNPALAERIFNKHAAVFERAQKVRLFKILNKPTDPEL